jgi:heat shock protein HtpX
MSVAKLLFAGASRTRERLADHDGARVSGDPLALATALERIEKVAAGRPMALPVGAGGIPGFCIVNPVTGLLQNHPPTHHLVYWLMRLAGDMEDVVL